MQFCSLYLNAEPLPEERVNPLLTSSSATTDSTSVRDPWAANTRVKSDGSLEEQWARKGLFRFVFNIQTLDDKTVLGTKGTALRTTFSSISSLFHRGTRPRILLQDFELGVRTYVSLVNQYMNEVLFTVGHSLQKGSMSSTRMQT